MDRAAVPHRIASTALQPFRRWDGGRRMVRLRAALWRLAGSGVLMRGLHLPRADLLIDPGDKVVLIGCQRLSKLDTVLELVGRDGRVTIIEANPDACTKLKGYGTSERVTLIHAAVWDSETDATIGVGTATTPSVRVLDGGQYDASAYDRTEEVRAAPLHLLLPNGLSPDYIEIAVNGTEPTVLRGCLDTLRESGSRIFLKNYGIGGNGEPARTPQLMSLLNNIKYSYAFAPTRPWYGRVRPHDPDGDILGYLNGDT